MSAYRVKVNCWVVVEASNQKAALAVAENAVRKCVKHGYTYGTEDFDEDQFSDAWERFGFQAVGKADRVSDDD